MSVRVGLFGAIANNLYCLTRVLRAQGVDATYIRDADDRYPMSQPLWEEAALVLDEQVLAAQGPSDEEWRELAADAGWIAPDWVVAERPTGSRPPLLPTLRLAARSGPGGARAIRAYARSRGIGRQLAEFDWLIVCGLGVIYAGLSGRPYVYWPHGGDVRVVPYRTESAGARYLGQALRAAVRDARRASSHDPTLVRELRKLGFRGETPYLPFVVDTERYRPGEAETTSKFPALVRERANGRSIVLLPSRQDFRWKHTDVFLRAFAAAARQTQSLLLVLSPWGNDRERARDLLREHGAADAWLDLPAVPSKPILRDLYQVADLVADQFAIGAYGTTMLEAMACGTPVLIALDLAAFTSTWPDYTPPPVVDAHDEATIRDALVRLATGELDVAELGARARCWVAHHHGPHRTRAFLPEGQ